MKEKSNTFQLVTLIGLIIVVLVLATSNSPSINMSSDGNTMQNTLSASGRAQLTVAPDEAVIFLNIITQGTTAKDAQDENKVIANKVMAALKAKDIADEDIETSSYNLNKKWEWDKIEQKSKEVGYELRHTLKITTTKLDQVGAVLDAAVLAGANGVDTVSYGLTKKTEEEVRAEALTKASKAAKDKANNIASAVGVKLGDVSSITESNFYYNRFEYAAANTYADFKESDGGVANSISPQKVEVQSSISVAYKIE